MLMLTILNIYCPSLHRNNTWQAVRSSSEVAQMQPNRLNLSSLLGQARTTHYRVSRLRYLEPELILEIRQF